MALLTNNCLRLPPLHSGSVALIYEWTVLHLYVEVGTEPSRLSYIPYLLSEVALLVTKDFFLQVLASFSYSSPQKPRGFGSSTTVLPSQVSFLPSPHTRWCHNKFPFNQFRGRPAAQWI